MSWPLVKLGDVAPAKASKHAFSTSDEVWTLNLDQVEADTGNLLRKVMAPVSEAGTSTHSFDERHVLYSKLRPYLNKVVLPDEKGLATTELVPMLPDPLRLDRKYLAYYLRSKSFVDWVSSQVAGAKMPRVSMQLFWQHEIPLPPMPEQKRIAAILDRADAIRRKRQQAIQLADNFLRSVFSAIFGDVVANSKGWDLKELGGLCDVQGGLQVSSKRTGLPITGPYLRVANVLRNKLMLTEIKNIEMLESEYRRVKLIADDILIVEGHGNPTEIGRCAVWTGGIDGVVHQNHLIRVRVQSKGISPRFLNDYLNSAGGRRQMMRASNTTSGLNTISTGIVKSTKIIVPPRDLQDKYVSIVERTNSHLFRYMSAQVLGDENFFSLSQRAFSGQL
ncbi:restriction endonuclease subunit S [Pseudomonas syringae]|uniref:restriction endonuclease subunit S n=1 Tax=Pseudomonas syringae TaxID=317 RepID=UPI000C06E290|nr:restriction endonuclease subunit S [Pseudomonas syringae]PHN44716.1 hypothetical protein AO254_08425 [Pseudomonas syringae]